MSQTNNSRRFSILALRLILALAILLGTFAVLPQATQVASAAGSKPVLTAKILTGAYLQVNGSNFVASRYYYIMARSAEGRARLGKVQATKQGKIDGKYKLTGKLMTAKSVRVCAQDTAKGKNYCTVAKK